MRKKLLVSILLFSFVLCSCSNVGKKATNDENVTEALMTESETSDTDTGEADATETGTGETDTTDVDTGEGFTTEEGYDYPDIPQYINDANCEVELDSTLACAIRRENGMGEDEYLSKEYLESLYEIRAFDDKITSLKGISYLKNLRVLMISGGYVTDISELSELTNLEMIDIAWCYIREIPDFSKLANLKELRLGANLIEDLSPVNKIPNLEMLDVSSCRVKYLMPIADYEPLQTLCISSNCILDYGQIPANAPIINAINNGTFNYDVCLELENRAKEIVAEITDDSMTDLQKEVAIYKYIIDNTEYVEESFSESAFGYRAIMENKGVCGNYAEAFALLACHAGINAGLCSSDTHTWNIIELDGKYYHCDSLWDEGNEYWNFFNISTDEIINVDSHFHDTLRYPVSLESMDTIEYYDDMTK